MILNITAEMITHVHFLKEIKSKEIKLKIFKSPQHTLLQDFFKSKPTF